MAHLNVYRIVRLTVALSATLFPSISAKADIGRGRVANLYAWNFLGFLDRKQSTDLSDLSRCPHASLADSFNLSGFRSSALSSDTNLLLCPSPANAFQVVLEQDLNIDRLVRSLDNFVGKKILSLGEGEAGLVRELVEAGVDAYGLDISDAYREKTKAIFRGFEARLIHGDASNFHRQPFAAGGFDLVIASHLLCSVPNELTIAILVEAVRATRPGGEARFIFDSLEINSSQQRMDPDNTTFQNIIREALAKLESDGIRARVAQFRGYHFRELATRPSFHQLIVFVRGEN